MGKNNTVLIAGITTIIFTLFDIIRLWLRKLNIHKSMTSILKSGEEKKFSSMTMFLIALTLTLFIVEKSSAFLVITLLIFGDMYAKFFGIQYGKTKIFNKTAEGSLAYLSSALICGQLLSKAIPLTNLEIIIGSLIATFVEVLPLPIDDNFSVAAFTSLVLYLIKK